MNYGKHYSTVVTPQSEPLEGQVQNAAGGYAYPVDDWKRLDRFLILGSEGGSYYAGERKLTRDNAKAVERCIAGNPWRVVKRVVEISDSGRAAKNDPALFVLAMCTTSSAKKQAFDALPKVARIGTHLFHFAEYVSGFRGWGRGLREAIANWYDEKSPTDLEYQAVKYRQRDGWTHRDLLRLAHPKNERNNAVYHWITQGEANGLPLIEAFMKAEAATSEREVVALIRDNNLPWEAIDTKWLGSAKVWEALLERIPAMALVRNLGRMTANGLLGPFSDANKRVLDVLGGKLPRVHPFALLLALKTYSCGHGMKGSLTWTPVSAIVDALDNAFYAAFGNVTPTNKRIVLALDVSGSMDAEMMGSPLTCREAAAAMALVTARTEPNHQIMAFAEQFVPLEISPRERLDDVTRKMSVLQMGATDCALPMMWALGYGVATRYTYGFYNRERQSVYKADAFVVYTDSETWCGKIHPTQALAKYRQESGVNAKLVVTAFTANEVSIADPNDAGTMDVVGFDASAPDIISQFIAE
ncbi:MAG: TROVE domain-containing protein [Dehalococcoidia bacterium]